MRYDIGIDLGGTNIVTGVVDGSGKILKRVNKPTDAGREPKHIIKDMAELALSAAEKAGVAMGDVGSVGVGVPGAANADTGIVEYAPNLYWRNVPLAEMLGAEIGMPVHIGNDANAAAYGEYTSGAGKGHGSVVAITLGTGIGGGAIENGKLLTGFNHAAMEVGHMVIRRGGRACACGRLGCWERYASATGLIITTRSAMGDDKDTKLWELVDGDIGKVEGRTAFDAMKAGDETAKTVIATYIDDLACGVINLINIFQPDILCVGGGVSEEGETLLAPLRGKVMEEVFSKNSEKNTEIVRAKLGNGAGVIGAAHLYKIREADK
ncbi:MAG: ROK family glucokinase [Clostridiales Family XIII bacterium]|jgi:glucokinase|nr:ROK family glucokinase [Clostridiales Family XIII bacterium]